jgi:hypothetical protein
MQWYERSILFSDALLRGDLAGTYLQYHPGVTVTWLSGLALKVFARLNGLTSGQVLGMEPTPPGVIARAVVAGVQPLAFVIALCIVLSYLLLRRLAGSRVALAAAVLLALDPFYIARGQVLHLDGLLATFMLVSALFLLNHVRHQRLLDLLLSGAFGGLALLTKTPALFLLPYTALVVGVHQLTAIHCSAAGWRDRVHWLRETTQKVLLWTLVVAVTFVALWPAMWVQPTEVLVKMTQAVRSKVEDPHFDPTFFNGQVVEAFKAPSPLFYLATLGWKTTLVTLPMAALAMVLAALGLRRNRRSGMLVLWFVAYAAFFTVQMCLAARKAPRYILPAVLPLDVIAAFGLVWTAEAVARADRGQKVLWLPSAILAGLLALQASLVLPRHPYYGTLYNRLLGGARAARHMLPLQQEGEGLDLAARYLNTLPNAPYLTVGVDERGAAMFERYFIGSRVLTDDPQADYRVYFVNQVVRQLHIGEWGKLWAVDQQGDPLWTVAFGGVPYVRIYDTSAGNLAMTEPEYEMEYLLGDHIQLKRVSLNAGVLIPGRSLVVAPLWESDGQVEGSYKVFCHLLSEDRELVGQRDDLPVHGARPTYTWREGELIEDEYKIRLDHDVSPGEYELSIGMYDPDSMERLPAYNAAGERMVNDRIVVGRVMVASTDW